MDMSHAANCLATLRKVEDISTFLAIGNATFCCRCRGCHTRNLSCNLSRNVCCETSCKKNCLRRRMEIWQNRSLLFCCFVKEQCIFVDLLQIIDKFHCQSQLLTGGVRLRESANKRKTQFSFSSVRVRLRESVRLRECVNTEFDWDGKRGFEKASVSRAVRLRECPLAESWLYFILRLKCIGIYDSMRARLEKYLSYISSVSIWDDKNKVKLQ